MYAAPMIGPAIKIATNARAAMALLLFFFCTTPASLFTAVDGDIAAPITAVLTSV